MDLGIKDKVAIVTASSKGLGRAVALKLAEEGAKVAICSRGIVELEKTKSEIMKIIGPNNVIAKICDVTNRSQIQEFIKEVYQKWKKIHILFCNAGGPPPGEFEDFSLDDWQESLELNLKSYISMCKGVIPKMKEQNWGRIIFNTSISVKMPLHRLILSNTVRNGVIGLSKSLSNELGKFNILVNSVCPGYTLTDRVKQLALDRAKNENRKQEEIISELGKDTALNRIGNPEEYANVVAFLSSEKASYITGISLPIDGGFNKGIN
ncbi:MAG: SDR family oxidoreductase [Candidatus Ranarchaeia archaeon]